MIDGIFCAEFDLLKGCVVRAHYPQTLSFDDVILSAYMLPDGSQKFEWDISQFRAPMSESTDSPNTRSSVSIINAESTNHLVDLHAYNPIEETWKLLLANCTLKVANDASYFLFEPWRFPFSEKDGHSEVSPIRFSTHPHLQYRKLKDDFFSFYAAETQPNTATTTSSKNNTPPNNNISSFGINFKPSALIQTQAVLELLESFDEQLQQKQSNLRNTTIPLNQNSQMTSPHIPNDVPIAQLDPTNKTSSSSKNATSSKSTSQQLKLREEYSFFTLIKNKRDERIKRGLLTRGVCIASKSNNILHDLEPAIKYYLDIFMEFPIEEDPAPVLRLLQEAFTSINNLPYLPLSLLRSPATSLVTFNDISPITNTPIGSGNNYNPIQATNISSQQSQQSPFSSSTTTTTTTTQTVAGQSSRIIMKLNDQFEFAVKRPQKQLCAAPDLSSNASLLEFVRLFQEKTMRIWQAILKEQRILFIGYEKSVRENLNFVAAVALLALPLNLKDRCRMYCHLQDLSFLEYPAYIAVVTNPLFENREQWWDICCDLSDFSVREAKKSQAVLNKISEARMNALDREFYSEVDRRIKASTAGTQKSGTSSSNNNSALESEVRAMFAAYTRQHIQCMMNSANSLEFSKDEKHLQLEFSRRAQHFYQTATYASIVQDETRSRLTFKSFFGELKYIAIFESLLILKDTRILNDLELITLYSAIHAHAITEQHLQQILAYVFDRKGSFECLAIGLFSKSEPVRRKNVEMLASFETFHIGRQLLKSLSFMMLYAYENTKPKYIKPIL